MRATPFAVLATARSGSWHLVELLNNHPNIVSNGEILNSDDTSWPADARPMGSTACDVVDWALREAPGRGSKGSTAARGVKILDEQFLANPGLWEHLVSIPDLKIVLLRRPKMLHSLRSKRQAETTGVWQVVMTVSEPQPAPVVRLELDECLRYFSAVTTFIADVRVAFSSRIHEVTYEDLCDRSADTLTGICRFLEVPPHSEFASVLRRQETRSPSDVIVGYDELIDQLQRTQWGDPNTRPPGVEQPW